MIFFFQGYLEQFKHVAFTSIHQN